MGEEDADSSTDQERFAPRATVNEVPAAVYHLDPDGRLEWGNDRVAAVTGYTDEELSGMGIERLLTAEDAATVRETLDGSAPGDRWSTDLPVVTKGGETVALRHEVAVTTDDSGERDGVTGVAFPRGGNPVDRAGARTSRQLVETVSRVIGALVTAGTEPERAVCEALVGSELYDAVWVGHTDGNGGVEPVTAAGLSTSTVAEMISLWRETGASSPAAGETRVVRDIPASSLAEPIRAVAADHGIASVASVPIGDDGTTTGVFVVCSARSDAFDETETRALEQLGRFAGFALTAAHAERLVLSEPAVELEFRLTGDAVPFVELARTHPDASGSMEWMICEPNGDITQYYTIDGVAPESVVERTEAAAHVKSCTPVGESDSALYELRLRHSVASELLSVGAETKSVTIEDGEVTATVTAPHDIDVRAIVERVRSVYPGAEFVAKRTLDGPAEEPDGSPWSGDVSLTDRQLTALAAAFDAGYFEWPRDATAEEVAGSLDISAATLHYHLRRAERSLVDSFLATKRS